MKYAVNLGDLTTFTRPDDILNPYMMLLQPVLTREIVNCEREHFDGMAVLVDATEERFEAILKIIREGLGKIKAVPKHKLRIYVSKTGKGGWKRV